MNQTLPGDALILAGIISYLGPFSPDIRTELLSKWRELCQTGSININPEDPRASLFTYSDTAPPYPTLGFPIPVSERLQLPLGQALCMNKWQLQKTTSARLVSKLLLWGCTSTWVQRWPLLADTQHHLEISCQNCLITGMLLDLEKSMLGFWDLFHPNPSESLVKVCDNSAVQSCTTKIIAFFNLSTNIVVYKMLEINK